MKKEWLENLTEMKFEDDFFKVPVEYDKILKIIYGDYMKLPPEEDRLNYHSVMKVKF